MDSRTPCGTMLRLSIIYYKRRIYHRPSFLESTLPSFIILCCGDEQMMVISGKQKQITNEKLTSDDMVSSNVVKTWGLRDSESVEKFHASYGLNAFIKSSFLLSMPDDEAEASDHQVKATTFVTRPHYLIIKRILPRCNQVHLGASKLHAIVSPLFDMTEAMPTSPRPSFSKKTMT